MTELVAGLLAASMLIVGLAEITRRYTQTTVHVREATSAARTSRIVDGLMRELERADPGTLVVSPDHIAAQIGSAEIRAELVSSPERWRLDWSSPDLKRSISVPPGTRFERTGTDTIALLAADEEPPLATANLLRTVPFDCQFDTVTRACR